MRNPSAPLPPPESALGGGRGASSNHGTRAHAGRVPAVGGSAARCLRPGGRQRRVRTREGRAARAPAAGVGGGRAAASPAAARPREPPPGHSPRRLAAHAADRPPKGGGRGSRHPANRQWRDRHQRLSRSVTGAPDRPRAASEAVPLSPSHSEHVGKGGGRAWTAGPPAGETNEAPFLATWSTGRSVTDPRTQCTTDARPPWQAASTTRRCPPSHGHAPARVDPKNATRPCRVPRRGRDGAAAAQERPKLGILSQPIISGTLFNCKRSAAVGWVGVVIRPLSNDCKRHPSSAPMARTTRSLVQVDREREFKATDRTPYRVSRGDMQSGSCKGL